MKAQTKLQKEIVSLSSKLEPISCFEKSFYEKKCAPAHVVSSAKGRMTCLQCGHQWSNKGSNVPKNVTCPHCGKILSVEITLKKKKKDIYYYLITSVCEGKQVWRMFAVFHFMEKGKPICYEYREVFQLWLTEDGRMEVMSLLRCPSSFYYDQWSYCSEMELRSCKTHESYAVEPYVHCNHGYIPKLYQVGIELLDENVFSFYTLCALLKDNRIETLLKVGEKDAFKYALKHDINPYWDSIRVCLRHKYHLTEDWFAYVRMLRLLEKDLRNPHYICPADFRASYDAITELHRRKERRIQLEQQRQRELRKLETAQMKECRFFNEKGKYLNLSFTDGEITINPLKSIREFYDEAQFMHHCLFSNSYYEKNGSLILSAKLDGERLETIEVDIEGARIVQSRGKYNENTPYHSQIMEIVNQHMSEITQIAAA